MTSIFLPFPPSVNNMFANRKGGRIKTNKYKLWLKSAKADLDFQKIMDGFKWENHKGQVDVIMLIKAPDKCIRDLDNLAKGVLDFLVSQKVIAGDDSRYVRSLHMRWKDNMPKAGCFVLIEKSAE